MGRSQIPIDWDQFFKLVSYQCTQAEIADWFHCSVDTIDRACKRDLNMSFAEVWNKKKSLGRIKLRKLQFEIIEKMGPGAATMAIYLDKKMFPDENPDRQIPDDLPSNEVEKIEQCLSFEQFSINAGYPKPFPKQHEMMEFGMNGDEPRLLLGSRGYGKTDYVTIMGIAYDLYRAWKKGEFPTNLIITKSKTRNTAIIEEIEEACKCNGMTFEKANASVLRIHGIKGKDHSVEAITIKSSMRGRHPNRVLMDDPVTDEDVSPAMRDLVKRRYDEIYKLCKNILIIGQPAHKHDLYAQLRKLIKKMEVPHGTIPELDDDLEAMKLAGVDEGSIEMSYHLRIPVDGTTPFEKIRYIDRFPVGDSAVAFIDPSHEGGDYTALTILKGYMEGVAVYGKVWKKAWNHCLDDMVEPLRKCNVRKLAFETNALGDDPIIQLRKLLAHLGIGVIGLRSNTNKHSRIMAAGTFANLIHLSKESDQAYTKQVVEYEYKAPFDDAPDSLATCLKWIGLIKGKE